MNFLRTCLQALPLLVFVGCGPLQDDNPVAGLVPALSGQGGAASEQPARLSQALTREAIEASPFDLLLVSVVERDAEATLQEVGTNRGAVTWFSVDGIGVTLRNGLIISTRGLGDDLMGADSAEAEAALRRGTGSVTRIHDYLTGLGQIERRTILCEFSDLGSSPVTIYGLRYATREIREDCRFPGGSFQNRYWIDGQGTVWQSRQWLSFGVGYVDYQRL